MAGAIRGMGKRGEDLENPLNYVRQVHIHASVSFAMTYLHPSLLHQALDRNRPSGIATAVGVLTYVCDSHKCRINLPYMIPECIQKLIYLDTGSLLINSPSPKTEIYDIWFICFKSRQS
jgi:hypothetical protein